MNSCASMREYIVGTLVMMVGAKRVISPGMSSARKRAQNTMVAPASKSASSWLLTPLI